MTTKPEAFKPTLEPCPLSHYVSAGLKAYKTGHDPRVVCLDCGLTLCAPDWTTVYERWQSRARVGVPTVDNLQRRLYEECVTANWDPEQRNTFAEEIAHLHEELSEAFRAWRRYKDCEVREVNGKLEGVPIEFADVLIGMFYNAELYGFDLLAAVERKHQFNLARNYVAEGRQLHAPAPASPVAPQQSEPQYLTINGQRRMVIPCPDGKPDCEVLHTAPAPSAAIQDEITTYFDHARTCISCGPEGFCSEGLRLYNGVTTPRSTQARAAAEEWFVRRGEKYPEAQPAIDELTAIIERCLSEGENATNVR